MQAAIDACPTAPTERERSDLPFRRDIDPTITARGSVASLMIFGRATRHVVKTARKATDTRRNSRQTRSATYVLPFSEQKGKTGRSADPSAGPQEQCAPRYPLESSPIFRQVNRGKQALESDQFTVTHHAVHCGKKIGFLSDV